MMDSEQRFLHVIKQRDKIIAEKKKRRSLAAKIAVPVSLAAAAAGCLAIMPSLQPRGVELNALSSRESEALGDISRDVSDNTDKNATPDYIYCPSDNEYGDEYDRENDIAYTLNSRKEKSFDVSATVGSWWSWSSECEALLGTKIKYTNESLWINGTKIDLPESRIVDVYMSSDINGDNAHELIVYTTTKGEWAEALYVVDIAGKKLYKADTSGREHFIKRAWEEGSGTSKEFPFGTHYSFDITGDGRERRIGSLDEFVIDENSFRFVRGLSFPDSSEYAVPEEPFELPTAIGESDVSGRFTLLGELSEDDFAVYTAHGGIYIRYGDIFQSFGVKEKNDKYAEARKRWLTLPKLPEITKSDENTFEVKYYFYDGETSVNGGAYEPNLVCNIIYYTLADGKFDEAPLFSSGAMQPAG